MWFGDPAKEFLCEEIEDDVVLIKDRRGKVIGLERLNYLSKKQHMLAENVPVEVHMM